MDDKRFDAMTRAMANGNSRRQLLKRLLGIGVAATGGAALRSESAQAARRPSPTPRPPRCPGQQTWDGTQCVCPAGTIGCGPDCCPVGVATCCDNACCYGNCYGEELCCPTGSILCDGTCQDWACCTDAECTEGQTCNPETHTCESTCDPNRCGEGGCFQCGQGYTCYHGQCFLNCEADTLNCPEDCQTCQIFGNNTICADSQDFECIASDAACQTAFGPGWYCSPGGQDCIAPCGFID